MKYSFNKGSKIPREVVKGYEFNNLRKMCKQEGLVIEDFNTSLYNLDFKITGINKEKGEKIFKSINFAASSIDKEGYSWNALNVEQFLKCNFIITYIVGNECDLKEDACIYRMTPSQLIPFIDNNVSMQDITHMGAKDRLYYKLPYINPKDIALCGQQGTKYEAYSDLAKYINNNQWLHSIK